MEWTAVSSALTDIFHYLGSMFFLVAIPLVGLSLYSEFKKPRAQK